MSNNDHLLLYETFCIKLFSPFKAEIQKASPKMRNSTTILQLTLYIESIVLPAKFSSRLFFPFNLAFTGIYLLKINLFNWTLNESTEIHCDYAVSLFILLIKNTEE